MIREILDEAGSIEKEVFQYILDARGEKYPSHVETSLLEVADKYGTLYYFQSSADIIDFKMIFDALVKGKYDDYIMEEDYNTSTFYAYKKGNLKKTLAGMEKVLQAEGL